MDAQRHFMLNGKADTPRMTREDFFSIATLYRILLEEKGNNCERMAIALTFSSLSFFLCSALKVTFFSESVTSIVGLGISIFLFVDSVRDDRGKFRLRANNFNHYIQKLEAATPANAHDDTWNNIWLRCVEDHEFTHIILNHISGDDPRQRDMNKCRTYISNRIEVEQYLFRPAITVTGLTLPFLLGQLLTKIAH